MDFLRKYRYFLKSTSGMWILPLVIINILVPIATFFVAKTGGTEATITIQKIAFFFLPMSTVWTSIFVSEVFFSERTKDALFFYGTKKRFLTSLLIFIVFLIDSVVVTLLSFYCFSDFLSLVLKIVCVSVCYYGIAMVMLRASKSSTMSLMMIIMYAIANTILNLSVFPFYENYEPMTLMSFATIYLPLVVTGIILIVLTYVKKGARSKEQDNSEL